jgi:hypothetical protein
MRREMDEFDRARVEWKRPSLPDRDQLIRKALKRLVPTGHSWTNGRPDPPGKSDYDQAEALATVAIALSLGELTAEVRRLIEVVERRDRR